MGMESGFGMPHFPDRSADLVGRLHDWIDVQAWLDAWDDACPPLSPEIQRILADGSEAEKIMDSLSIDNRGDT